MANITLYSTRFCPYCMRAKSLLNRKSVEYNEIRVNNPEIRAEMEKRSGRTSVPQIFIGEHHIGGYDDMAELDRSGKLDPLINNT